MSGVPIFIEVESTRSQQDINLCCQLVSMLTEKQIAPIGLAGTVHETASLLMQIAQEALTPAIFIINTFGARDILPGLDGLIGDLPVIYLRRQIFAGQSGLQENIDIVNPMGTSLTLSNMKARLTSMWFYGSRTSSTVTARLKPALLAFLQDGDFHHIERRNEFNPAVQLGTATGPHTKRLNTFHA